jgi:hypothetical protein
MKIETKIKTILISILMSITMMSQAAVTELNEEDMSDKSKVIDFFKILAVIKDVDGTINNNKITYDEQKYEKIDIESKLTGLQPMVEKLSKAPKENFVKVGDLYLYIVDTKSKSYNKAQQTLKVNSYKNEVKLKKYDPSNSELENVMYIAYISSLDMIGKDINKEVINLTQEDKDELYNLKKMASSNLSDVINYTVCFDGQITGIPGINVMFHGVRYYITKQESCDKTKDVVKSEEYPSKVNLIEYDETMGDLEKLGYVSFLSALVEAGKDITKKEINLTKEDYDMFDKITESYKLVLKNIVDYTVCLDNELMESPIMSVTFNNVNYHIIEKTSCNKSR